MKFSFLISSIDDKNFFQEEMILQFRVNEEEPKDIRKPFWELINKRRVNEKYDWEEEILYREDYDTIQTLSELQFVLNEICCENITFENIIIENQNGTIWEISVNDDNIIYYLRVLSTIHYTWREFSLNKDQIIMLKDLLALYLSYFQ